MIINRCYTNKKVFEKYPSNGYISMNDVDLAYEICSCMDDKNKNDCYTSFGVDGVNVEKYYINVKRLNQMFYNKSNIFEVLIKFFQILINFIRIVYNRSNYK